VSDSDISGSGGKVAFRSSQGRAESGLGPFIGLAYRNSERAVEESRITAEKNAEPLIFRAVVTRFYGTIRVVKIGFERRFSLGVDCDSPSTKRCLPVRAIQLKVRAADFDRQRCSHPIFFFFFAAKQLA
jgi:hypothetical protein